MFSEEIFLRKAGLFNSKLQTNSTHMISKSLFVSKNYFSETPIDPLIIAKTFVQLTYRNPKYLSTKTRQISIEMADALDYLRQHKAEALLSSEPIIRAFAEVLCKLD